MMEYFERRCDDSLFRLQSQDRSELQSQGSDEGQCGKNIR
jgi:hypothetical protein